MKTINDIPIALHAKVGFRHNLYPGCIGEITKITDDFIYVKTLEKHICPRNLKFNWQGEQISKTVAKDDHPQHIVSVAEVLARRG